jgi:hypothetical protein
MALKYLSSPRQSQAAAQPGTPSQLPNGDRVIKVDGGKEAMVKDSSN